VSGDTDLAVTGGASLVFHAGNYTVEQTVTISAAADGDTANGSATFECSAPGYLAATVIAIESDTDVPPVSEKINSGGAAASDNWEADGHWVSTGAQGTSVSSAAIANAVDAPQAVYQSRRWGTTLTYNLNVPDGTYNVRLHFAELYWTSAGHRRFDLFIEGQEVLSDYDIWAAAGGINRARTETFENVVVGDGNGLQIQGIASLGVVQVNGVEVWSTGALGQAKAVPSERTVAKTVSSGWPVAWVRSGVAEWQLAPELTDGDSETLWRGSADSTSWSIALDFEEVVPLQALDLIYADQPWTEVGVMATEDLVEWMDLERVADRPVNCRALFLHFGEDGSGHPPAIREIEWEEEAPLHP
jgi:hypothetical protein